uniref:Ring finger protein 220 n=1 Tax=Eptatretus burgeri TaxID=7764 RepID=A0A8C4QB74_EPTBU
MDEQAAKGEDATAGERLLRVESNKEIRENGKRHSKRRRAPHVQPCPVCSRLLSGSQQAMSRHVEACLKKLCRYGERHLCELRACTCSCLVSDDPCYPAPPSTTFEQSVPDEVEEEVMSSASEGEAYDEYTWCGQKRVRATSLLQGGFRGSGFATCSSVEPQDSDGDLDVDGDETLAYGKPQYTEADIIQACVENTAMVDECEVLQDALLNREATGSQQIQVNCKRNITDLPSTSQYNTMTAEPQKTQKNSKIERVCDSSTAAIEALRNRVAELEALTCHGENYKCLICMEPYTVPLTSIQCWHVHCEECWMRTLGVKKLCPQCNTITSPGDLRKIYL